MRELYVMKKDKEIAKVTIDGKFSRIEPLIENTEILKRKGLLKYEDKFVNYMQFINWMKWRVFPEERVDCEKILKKMNLERYNTFKIAEVTKASLIDDDIWIKFYPEDDYYKDTIRGRAESMGLI